MRRTRFAKAFHKGHKKGQSKLEQAYEGLLAGRKLGGEIADYKYEPISLKLAEGVRYIPDFMVEMPDGEIQLHEVKAGREKKVEGVRTGETVPLTEDASRIKIRMAAKEFAFRFVLAYFRKGTWYFEEV